MAYNTELPGSGILQCRRKYPDDPKREAFEAARTGDADLLSGILQQMNSSERTSALETAFIVGLVVYCIKLPVAS